MGATAVGITPSALAHNLRYVKPSQQSLAAATDELDT